MIIDSLQALYKACDAVSKATNSNEEFKFEFLLSWHKFDSETKNKKYSAFFSHEMNLFLKLKDWDFFEGVARPFISCKMEKSFLDYWLLDDIEELNQKYNTFEAID